MCLPLMMVASLALTAAATYSSIQTQKRQAAAQIQYQGQLRQANAQSYMIQSNQLSDAKSQENQQMAVQKQRAFLANEASLSSAKAQMGALGMSGANLQGNINDFSAKQLQFDMSALRQHTLNENALDNQGQVLMQNYKTSDLQLARPIALPDTNSAWLNWGAGATQSLYGLKR